MTYSKEDLIAASIILEYLQKHCYNPYDFGAELRWIDASSESDDDKPDPGPGCWELRYNKKGITSFTLAGLAEKLGELAV